MGQRVGNGAAGARIVPGKKSDACPVPNRIPHREERRAIRNFREKTERLKERTCFLGVTASRPGHKANAKDRVDSSSGDVNSLNEPSDLANYLQ